jgi:hypothetical protein
MNTIPLDLYLEEHGTAGRLARKTGLSKATISRAVHGCPLAFRNAMLVEAASGGRVRAETICDDVRALAVFRSMVAA